MVKLALVVEVDHLVAVVATRHVHYALVLGPVSANRLVTRVQGFELVVRDDWVPFRDVVLVIHDRYQVLNFKAFIVLGIDSKEGSSLVVLAATFPG